MMTCTQMTFLPPSRSAWIPAAGLLLLAGIGLAPAKAATLAQSVDVQASPAEVWALIGPTCAIETWLPPVGSCREDGGTPPTRTLVTKDKSATFVEREMSRSDAQHFYSYTFISSPLPVHNYHATIKVTARGNGGSTVTWSGEYVPDSGKEQLAHDALGQIYKSGLDFIAASFPR